MVHLSALALLYVVNCEEHLYSGVSGQWREIFIAQPVRTNQFGESSQMPTLIADGGWAEAVDPRSFHAHLFRSRVQDEHACVSPVPLF